MVPDSDEINLSTVELQVLTELDRLVDFKHFIVHRLICNQFEGNRQKYFCLVIEVKSVPKAGVYIT